MAELLGKNLTPLIIGGMASISVMMLLDYIRTPKFLPQKHFKEYDKKKLNIPIMPIISIEALTKEIPIILENGFLSPKTIKMIWSLSIELIKQEYFEMTLKNRKERRKVFYEDLDKYMTLVSEYIQKNEEIINKGDNELISALNIDKETFDGSLDTIFNAGNFDQLMIVIVGRSYKLK